MTAFITRDLSPGSDFETLLAEHGWQVEGRSLVELSPLPFREVPAADWIFFSSKNAVRFFFQHLRSDDFKSSDRSTSPSDDARPTDRSTSPSDDFKSSDRSEPSNSGDSAKSGGDFESPPDWAGPSTAKSDGDLESPPDRIRTAYPRVKWAALGPATAQTLAEYVGTVDFVGTGEPVSTAEKFNPTPGPSPTGRGALTPGISMDAGDEVSPLAMGEEPGVGSILFPAARHSRQSVMSLLAGKFHCIHFEIYDNRPVDDPSHVDAEVLVFTSPLNAQAYLARHKPAESQRVVAIGETTARALREAGIAEVYVSGEASEEALARTVLGLWG